MDQRSPVVFPYPPLPPRALLPDDEPTRPPEAREADAAKRAAAGVSKLPVLIVDDSEQDFVLLRAAFDFSGGGVGLRWAKSVEQAKAYFLGKPPFDERLKHPLPSLVLLDLQLQDSDGFEMLGWIRSQPAAWHRLPVIMLTTSNDRTEVGKAYDMGANSYLVKPTGFDELCRMIANLTEYWLKSNRQG